MVALCSSGGSTSVIIIDRKRNMDTGTLFLPTIIFDQLKHVQFLLKWDPTILHQDDKYSNTKKYTHLTSNRADQSELVILVTWLVISQSGTSISWFGSYLLIIFSWVDRCLKMVSVVGSVTAHCMTLVRIVLTVATSIGIPISTPLT